MSSLRSPVRRRGLILLVVLGMLALFSLLAVTYVVFAGQSRAASMALARSEIRGQKSHKRLMEEAVKSLIREPRDLTPMSGHSLLADVYGATESSVSVELQVRRIGAATANDRPLIFSGHFLRIPLIDPASAATPQLPGLPYQSDVLNGRVVTFLDDQGPLSGKSFHIVRYIGNVSSYSSTSGYNSPGIIDQQYSITIDLNEADLQPSYSTSLAGSAVTGSIREWVLGQVPGTLPGIHACYRNGNATVNGAGYRLLLNAAALNTNGSGVLADGSSQFDVFATSPTPTVEPYAVATGLQPNTSELQSPSSPITNLLASAFGITNRQLTLASQTGFGPYGANTVLGDADEPYDAPDAQNMYLGFEEQNAQHPFQIIPSFHRAALINYLVNWSDPSNPGQPKDPTTWTEAEFLLTLHRVEKACLRPLSYNLILPSGSIARNPEFTGGNTGSSYSSPTLALNIANWNNWPTQGWPAFEVWLNSLTLGPWDVDNNKDGLTDSVFIDPGLPIETSAEGKLLKALVAYYVDDLDSRIDLNAAGNLAQADEPSIYQPGTQFTTPLANPKISENGQKALLSQGFGYGPAETSFRHLAPNAAAYRNLIASRYGAVADSFGYPGVGNPSATPPAPFTAYANVAAEDALSLVAARGLDRRVFAGNALWPDLRALPPDRLVAQAFQHRTLPGLPISATGRASIGLDRLGNPLIHTPSYFIGPVNNSVGVPDSWNDPYEGPYGDTRFTLAEWERIYRIGDDDRSTLPVRLQGLFELTDTALNTSPISKLVTPISRHLRVPQLAGRSRAPNEPYYQADGSPLLGNQTPVPQKHHHYDGRSVGPNSFLMLVNTIFRLKYGNGQPSFGVPEELPEAALRHLFPLEFHLGHPLNVNRPLGNGVDDDGDGLTDESGELVSQVAVRAQNANTAVATAVAEQYYEGSRIDTLDQTVTPAQRRVNFNFDRQTPPGAYQGLETRQLFARHLYCLAQLIIPEDYAFPNVNRDYFQQLVKDKTDEVDSGMPGRRYQEFVQLRGRILAQWAINVVDFRDADAEMTRFPYDPDPFRDENGNFSPGWNVQLYNPESQTYEDATNVAWGLEQPELLMTESLATHDIRVREVANSNPPEYEQYRIPEASLFLEFFCPRTTDQTGNAGNDWELAGAPVGSLYTNTADGVELNLGRVAPAGRQGVGRRGLPVWRVYLSAPHDKTATNGPTLRTPNERLMNSDDPTLAQPPNDVTANDAQRHDLTYQFGDPNAGLFFDYTQFRQGMTSEGLTQPNSDPDMARIITFAADGTFDLAGMPDVTSPATQVYSNRNDFTGTQMTVGGGQYVVVGPRPATYFGSLDTAATGDGGDPANLPNPHSILLNPPPIPNNNPPTPPDPPFESNWAQLDKADSQSGLRVGIQQRATMRNCVTMVAAADSVEAGWTTGQWNNDKTNPLIGINVSAPNIGTYYPEPTDQLNSNNSTSDADTGAPGFENLYEDAYWDFGQSAQNPNPRDPFDDAGQGTHLENWPLGAVPLGQNGPSVVRPGTELDWCTAYLQRLANPDRPYHAIYNPYITVDWMPIDLTVFNGEDDIADLDPPSQGSDNAIRFATRQKVGQALDASSLSYSLHAIQPNDQASPENLTGTTFLSALTDVPLETDETSQASAFFLHELRADEVDTSTNMPLVLRPTSANPTLTAGQIPDYAPFATLGYLNSGFAMSGEGGFTIPDSLYLGAPVDPEWRKPRSLPNPNWRPDALFFANRDFVNSLELMWVPTSAPGQLNQEFSATVSSSPTQSMYAAAYRQDDAGASGLLRDPRTPTAPYSPISGTPSSQDGLDNSQTIAGFNDAFEPQAYTPYAYLLNFFQEVPELRQPNLGQGVQPYDAHAKNTSLVTLLDMMETPSPWQDATRIERPSNMLAPTLTNAQDVATNVILAPLRAPYNQLPNFVESGRINLNTMAAQNVMFALHANTFPTAAERTNPGLPGFRTLWDRFNSSRRGYTLATEHYASQRPTATLPGAPTRGYDPNSFITADALPGYAAIEPGYLGAGGSLFFNPHFPTRFANVFKPAFSAGMVSATRNPFQDPGGSTSGPEGKEQLRLFQLADRKGVLDLYARKSAAQTSLLRGAPDVPFVGWDPASGAPATNPTTAGVAKYDAQPMYSDSQLEQRNPFTDFSQITRLQNLTTNRSNVFAVYMTMAFFEYDPGTGSVGIEYGADVGQAQRYRAFYIVDRSKPVGFQVGRDHNVEDTILVRRFLKTDD